MTVNKLKITVRLLTVVALVLIFSAPTILADTELYYPIIDSVTCHPGGPPTVTLANIEIYEGGMVIFKITSSCDSVQINGDSPIENFYLTTSNPQKSIIFLKAGVFNYAITDYDQIPPQTSSAKVTTILVTNPFPSLSTWGIIILIALIIVAGVYLWIRRKPVTT